MVELQPSKLVVRVRFPSPAPIFPFTFCLYLPFIIGRGFADVNLIQAFLGLGVH